MREVTVELFEGWLGRRARANASPRATREKGMLLADGKPAPPWFGLARAHMRRVPDHGMDAIRESIGRGWAQEVAESETAVRKLTKKAKR